MEVQSILNDETIILPTILIIEDEEDIADLLAYRLKREGFQAHVAYDGAQASD